MPITSTWSPRNVDQAAQAEELTREAVNALLQSLTPATFAGLAAWADDGANNGADLAAWKRAWPTVLGPLSDAEASAVVRVAVAAAGGVAV